jgi:hypothetical protein
MTTKNLVAVRINNFYMRNPEKKDTPEEYEPMCELIIIGDEAEYRMSNGGDVLRERKLSHEKYSFAKKNWPKIRELIDRLVAADETELA